VPHRWVSDRNRTVPAEVWMVGLLVLLLGIGAATLPACQRPPSDSATDPSPAPTAKSTASVVIYPSSGGAPLQVRVDLARTPAEQERGLMFRRTLDSDAGMLFLFEAPEIRRFWMRNTYVPLDMIFLDAKRTVVGIEENTIPLDETSRGPNQPAQYVVEVQAGYARKHGVGLGSRVEFRGVN
jgi:uncharacterized membrane protein (UPF0127 family)